jgi:hypothetical protein
VEPSAKASLPGDEMTGQVREDAAEAPPQLNAIAVITAGPGCPRCAGVPGHGGLRLTNEPADAVIRSCSVHPDG